MMLVMMFALSQAEGYIKEISRFSRSRLVVGGSCPASCHCHCLQKWDGCTSWKYLDCGEGRLWPLLVLCLLQFLVPPVNSQDCRKGIFTGE